jgi:hypothetical protein
VLDQATSEHGKGHDFQGEYAEAIALYEKPIKIKQKILIPTHIVAAVFYLTKDSFSKPS